MAESLQEIELPLAFAVNDAVELGVELHLDGAGLGEGDDFVGDPFVAGADGDFGQAHFERAAEQRYVTRLREAETRADRCEGDQSPEG